MFTKELCRSLLSPLQVLLLLVLLCTNFYFLYRFNLYDIHIKSLSTSVKNVDIYYNNLINLYSEKSKDINCTQESSLLASPKLDTCLLLDLLLLKDSIYSGEKFYIKLSNLRNCLSRYDNYSDILSILNNPTIIQLSNSGITTKDSILYDLHSLLAHKKDTESSIVNYPFLKLSRSKDNATIHNYMTITDIKELYDIRDSIILEFEHDPEYIRNNINSLFNDIANFNIVDNFMKNLILTISNKV